jgi:hypothetical protein
MEKLINRGVKTFKFLDRSFNVNIERSIRIMEFFLKKLEEKKFVVHFEMFPSIFPEEMRRTLSLFPPETLRVEIGVQTLNREVSARISRPSNPEKDLETIRWLRENTSAIIHADLIAGLPGEDLASFGRGFDRLWEAVCAAGTKGGGAEIQLGILKLLPGAPIARHSETFAMRYNSLPPYEVEETSVMSAGDLAGIKNFARFWEIIVNRGLVDFVRKAGEDRKVKPVFYRFLGLSDSLLARFGKNWGIEKAELYKAITDLIEK